MKAAWYETVGGPEVIQIGQRPDPSPRPGEALVAVRACSLNHLDVWVRRGKSFPRPIIPGSDVVGHIEACGPGVTDFAPGDEVVVFPVYATGYSADGLGEYRVVAPGFGMVGAQRDGGCAEKAVVPAETLVKKPSALAWLDAACLPIAFTTAWHMLFARAKVRPGETVLIQSAGSGVSHAAIQFAKLGGATVIATSSTEAKMLRARELGADHTIDYRVEDVAARVREITAGRGVDVVLDHTGAATWEANIDSLARGGRLVTCGVTQGAEVKLDLGQLFYGAQSILGSTMGTRRECAQVCEVVAAGRVRPVIDRVFPLEQIRKAHERLAAADRFGKVVIQVAA
jgi:NADPH:quinone reductase-like Zn-dependent oxidoreductase